MIICLLGKEVAACGAFVSWRRVTHADAGESVCARYFCSSERQTFHQRNISNLVRLCLNKDFLIMGLFNCVSRELVMACLTLKD